MGSTKVGKRKSLFNKIPKPALMFLFKAGFLYLTWVSVYHFFLEPKRIIDPPLTEAVASATRYVLSLVFPHNTISLAKFSTLIMIKNEKGTELAILDGCNALELYLFYIGFIICYSGSLNLSLKFVALGVIGITVLNIARCTALFYLSFIHFRYIDSVHHYVFTITVYSFIFVMWLNFFKASLKVTNKTRK